MASTNQIIILDSIISLFETLKSSPDFDSTNNFETIDNSVSALSLSKAEEEQIKQTLYSAYSFVREIK